MRLTRTLTFLGLAAFFAPSSAAAQRRIPDPQIPPPTITEYKPRNTLVVPEHPVPSAKFPVVDMHGHPPTLDNAENIATVLAAMDELNLGVMIQTRGSQNERLTNQIEAVRAAGLEDRFAFFTTLDLRNVGPGSGATIAAQLEKDVAAGAIGIGELSKAFGLFTRKADGTRLQLDDPELDVVWETAGRLGIPVFIHSGEPSEFFEPHDMENERWLEQSIYPRRQLNDREVFPAFDELMAERDRMIAKNPNTTWILAHMGWHGNDLGRLGELFDKYPNTYGELGAVLYDFGRQPRFAKRFFEQYSDRILFGKDSFQPAEYPYYWRVFETDDEYFDYYRNYHAFWKLYGMDLSDDVLRKVYYQNAVDIIPGLPTGAFGGR
jgi:uncharacterized protein